MQQYENNVKLAKTSYFSLFQRKSADMYANLPTPLCLTARNFVVRLSCARSVANENFDVLAFILVRQNINQLCDVIIS